MRYLKEVKPVLRALREYLGGSKHRRRIRVADAEDLARFLETRASHVAQTSLYGYIRTRAGARFPELFESDDFMVSMNIAKWQVWAACLSDLAVFAGGLALARSNASPATVSALVEGAVDEALARAGTPDEAGPDFAAGVAAVRARVKATDWSEVTDDEGPFTESPGALVKWAPIVEDLKELDSGIVRNSVRFRWREVRQDLRKGLDAEALVASLEGGREN